MLGFEPSHEIVPDHVIAGAQGLLEIAYPAEYIELLRTHSGASGDVDFRVDRASPGFDLCGFGQILSILPWSRRSVYAAMSNWPEHFLDHRVIPFAVDGGGNYACFDTRQGGEPKIVFWFHELAGDEGIIHVCDSFRDLLDRLQLPPADDDGA